MWRIRLLAAWNNVIPQGRYVRIIKYSVSPGIMALIMVRNWVDTQ